MDWLTQRLTERATWMAIIGLIATGIGHAIPGPVMDAVATAGPAVTLAIIAILKTPNA